MFSKDFFIKNKEKLQFTYGLALIILIPLLIIFNTLYIMRQYNNAVDEVLKKHAFSVGKTISILTENDLPWEIFIQKKIESLINSSIEIDEITVLKPEKSNFKVIASSNKKEIGETRQTEYYKLAWIQTGESGWVTDANLTDKKFNNDRFWLVSMPMKDAQGEKQALLTVKLSSRVVDDLTNRNGKTAVYVLVGILFIVILFLFVVIRLWDYAVLYKKIKEVDKMKDEFISIASHELRTPVTGIKGYASMISDGSLGKVSEKTQNAINIIQASAERLGALVDDLLSVSRIEQDRMTLNLRPADLHPIIIEVIGELKIQAEEKKLNLDYVGRLEKFPLVNIDVDKFKQVLINLVGNAIKYTKDGSVEIEAKEKFDGKILEIKVKDTGIGMSSKERKNLFQKFYRIKNEKTYGITGTGLGLWITKKLVELMNGTINVESIENIGTQIILQFPILNSSKSI